MMDLLNGRPDLRRSEEESFPLETKKTTTTKTLESSQCCFHSPTFPLAGYQSPARITSLTVSAFTGKTAEARAEAPSARIPTSQKQFPVVDKKLSFKPTQLVHARGAALTSIFVRRVVQKVVVVVIDNSLLATCHPDYLNRKRNSIFTRSQPVQCYSSLQ